jgi:hypothetical protein
MRDASGGRARYGSRSGGIREDIFGYESGRSWTPAPNLAAGLFSSGSRDLPSPHLPTKEPHSSATYLTSISKSPIILLNDVLFISVYTSLLFKTLFRRDISQIFANKSRNARILKSRHHGSTNPFPVDYLIGRTLRSLLFYIQSPLLSGNCDELVA